MSLLTNLISHWKLNEASGTRADSHSTNDLADNNTVTSATGKIGDAALFTAANNEWLSIADNAELSTGEVSFGCALWVKFTTLSAGQILIGKDNVTSGNREWGITFSAADSKLRFVTGQAGSATLNTVAASSFGVVTTGVWYFVMVWFDQPTGVLRISVNDGAVDTAGRAGTIPDTTAPFQIGRRGTDTATDADAAIDSVSFWKGGYPSAAEITQLYNGGAGLDYESFAGGSTIAITEASFAWAANDLTPVAGAVTVAIGTASFAWTANDVTPSAGAVTVALTPASFSWAANALTPAAGAVAVELTAASFTWTANNLTPSGAAATVALDPASFTWTANDLGVVEGVLPPCDRFMCDAEIESVGSAIVAAGYRLAPEGATELADRAAPSVMNTSYRLNPSVVTCRTVKKS